MREKLSIEFFVLYKLHTNEPPTTSQFLLYSSLRKVHLELNWSLKRKNWQPSWFRHASWHVTASAWVPFLIIFDLSRVQSPKVISLQGSSIKPLKMFMLKNVIGIIFIMSINHIIHIPLSEQSLLTVQISSGSSRVATKYKWSIDRMPFEGKWSNWAMKKN